MIQNHGTAIEWAHVPGYKGETWNFLAGCSVVSEGCRNCYATRDAAGRLLDGVVHNGFPKK